MSLRNNTKCSKATATTTCGAALIALSVLVGAEHSYSQEAEYVPEFTSDKMLKIPDAKLWREWPYVGSLVTPNAMNDGEAPFPEHHMVYIDPLSWDHYKKTGEFRQGTVIAKELTFVRAPDGAKEDGSTDEVSGTGYFMGEYSGFEITIKSEELYPDDPGNWAYYSFGHQPEPYNTTAMKQPPEACNSCHEAVAAEDFVFTQFYPVLRSVKPE